jgi:hypothetical protein
MKAIKPWVNAPLELIRHAEGHLKAGSDLDKRMALISYDNAIEVAIKTYLELHPVQRGGKQYERKQIDHWKHNYHTQLEFLEEHVGSSGQPMEVTRDEIIWYHQRRNHLYHAGDGLVPAKYDLQGIRKVALWVLSVLFDVDAEALLAVKTVSPPKQVLEKEEHQPPSEMVLIRSYMHFERALQAASTALGIAQVAREPFRALDVWNEVSRRLTKPPPSAGETVKQATEARNSIVDGKPPRLSEEALADLSARLDGITKALDKMVRDTMKPTVPQPADRRQAVLAQVRGAIGSEAADRLDAFLRTTRALEIRMHRRSMSLSYRLKSPRTRVGAATSEEKTWTVFFLTPHEHGPWLAFPESHWREAMPFGIEPYLDHLRALGCVDYPKPKQSELRLYLGEHNSAETFERLYGILQKLVVEMDRALTVRPEGKEALDPGAVQRLQHFLASLLKIGFVREEGKTADPYKATLLYQFREWTEHRPHPVTVFHLKKGPESGLRFRMDMLSVVRDLDTEELQARLLAAGCTRANRKSTPIELVLAERNDQATFDRLFEILQDLIRKHRVT